MFDAIYQWLVTTGQQSPMIVFPFAVATLLGLYFGFERLGRYRLIADVPTSKVRSAAQGYVELEGVAKAMNNEPILSPLSQTACCWYRFSIEEKEDNNWRTVDSGESYQYFILTDDTGDCLIDPEGATFDSLHKLSWNDTNYSQQPSKPARLAYQAIGQHREKPMSSSRSVVSSGYGDYRYSEMVILEGDPIYAIGEFKSQDVSDLADKQQEIVREVLRQWKANPKAMDQLDKNKDGKVDEEEWQRGVQAAKKYAQSKAQKEFDGTHAHMLRKPRKGKYLISNKHQDGLIKRFQWHSRFGFAVFALAGVCTAITAAAALSSA